MANNLDKLFNFLEEQNPVLFKDGDGGGDGAGAGTVTTSDNAGIFTPTYGGSEQRKKRVKISKFQDFINIAKSDLLSPWFGKSYADVFKDYSVTEISINKSSKRNIIATPKNKEGRFDADAVPSGASVWITISHTSSPLNGRHVLITKLPDGRFALTGGMGMDEAAEARRHLILGGTPKKTKRDTQLETEADEAESLNEPLRVAKKEVEKEARAEIKKASDSMLEALGIKKLDKDNLLEKKEEIQKFIESELGEGGKDQAKRITDTVMRHFIAAEREIKERVQAQRQVAITRVGKRLASLKDVSEIADDLPEDIEALTVDIPDVSSLEGLTSGEQELAISRHFGEQVDNFFSEEQTPASGAEIPGKKEKLPTLELGATIEPLKLESVEQLRSTIDTVKNYWDKRSEAEQIKSQIRKVTKISAIPSSISDLQKTIADSGVTMSMEEIEAKVVSDQNQWMRNERTQSFYDAVEDFWNDDKSLEETLNSGRSDTSMYHNVSSGAATALAALSQQYGGAKLDTKKLLEASNIEVGAAALALNLRIQYQKDAAGYDKVIQDVQTFNANNQSETERKALERHGQLKSQFAEIQRQKEGAELLDKVRIATLESDLLLEQRKNLGAALGSMQASAAFLDSLAKFKSATNDVISINVGKDVDDAYDVINRLKLKKGYTVDTSDPDNVKINVGLSRMDKLITEEKTVQSKYEKIKTDMSGVSEDEEGRLTVDKFDVPGFKKEFTDEAGKTQPYKWRVEQRNDINWLREASKKTSDNPEGIGGGLITRVTGAGKCMEWDEPVFLADGRVVSAGSLVDTSEEIIGLTDLKTMKQVPTRASFSDNGIRRVLEIKLDNGVVIKRTEEHPLWAGTLSRQQRLFKYEGQRAGKASWHVRVVKAGWASAGDIKPYEKEGYETQGHVILCPTTLLQKGVQSQTNAAVILCAVLLSEGSLSRKHTVRFSTASPTILQLMSEAAAEYSCEVVPTMNYDYRIRGRKSALKSRRENQVNQLVRQWGINHYAYNKVVPQWVFQLPDEQVALFLQLFFECDGWVDSAVHVGLANQLLVKQLSQLALRLGITGSLRDKQENGFKGSWTWSTGDLKLWREKVGLVEKSVRLEKEYLIKAGRKEQMGENAWRTAQPNEFQNFSDCPVGYQWRKVISVHETTARTVAVEVFSDNHAYVGEVVEHNTNTAYGFFGFQMKENPDYKALAIVPKGRVQQWVDEAKKFTDLNIEMVPEGLARDKVEDLLAKSKKGTVYVMAHREAARASDMLSAIQEDKDLQFSGFVVDEPQELQARGQSGNIGEMGRRIFKVPVKHRIALTATPARRNPTEAYDLLHWTTGGSKEIGSKAFFKRVFSGLGSGTNAQDTAISNMFFKTVHPYISGDRLTTPNFKVKQESVAITRSPEQVQRQKEIEAESAGYIAKRREEISNEVRNNPGHSFRRSHTWETRLGRYANDTARKEVAQMHRENFDNRSVTTGAKMVALKNELKKNLEKKQVIYIDSQTQRHSLQAVFEELGLKQNQIKNIASGVTSMTGEEMTNRAHAFQKDPNVKVILIDKNSSTGFNLQQGSVLHVIGTPDAAATLMQAQGRIARMPRTGDVEVKSYRYSDNPSEASLWNDLDNQIKVLRASSPGMFVGT